MRVHPMSRPFLRNSSVAAAAYCYFKPSAVLLPTYAGITPRDLVGQLAERLSISWQHGIGWVLRRCAEKLRERPFVLVFDDAHYLAESLGVVVFLHDHGRCGIAFLGLVELLEQLRSGRDATARQALNRLGRATILGRLTLADARAFARALKVKPELGEHAFGGWRDLPGCGAEGQARRLVRGLVGAKRKAADREPNERDLRAALKIVGY